LPLAGSDGKVLAVITRNNEVIAMQAGRELWRQLTAQAFTARSWQVSACCSGG
jgi:hypothetical protein